MTLTNYERSEHARRALSDAAYLDGDDIEAAIVDLITDLCHLANVEGKSVGAVLALARAHYETEHDEEESRSP